MHWFGSGKDAHACPPCICDRERPAVFTLKDFHFWFPIFVGATAFSSGSFVVAAAAVLLSAFWPQRSLAPVDDGRGDLRELRADIELLRESVFPPDPSCPSCPACPPPLACPDPGHAVLQPAFRWGFLAALLLVAFVALVLCCWRVIESVTRRREVESARRPFRIQGQPLFLR